MKAWLSHTPGGPHSLVLEEVPIPSAQGGDLLVKVEAVGINFPDSLLLRDLYQVRPARPFSPGGEFCGVVTGLGPDVSGFSVGDVVVGRCVHGAMAQWISIGSDRCQKVPTGMSRTDAAAFLFAYATAYHALRSAGGLVAGETVLIIGGSGGVGSAAVDLARALGARVLVAVSSQEKLDFAKSCGAETGIVYPPCLESAEQKKALSAELKALAGSSGIDVVLDPVGGEYSDPALRCLGPLGRYLVVGFTSGIPKIPLNLVLLNGRKIIGVDWKTLVTREPEVARGNLQHLFQLWERGEISPKVTKAYAFAQAPAAIEQLESRASMGKVVVTIDHDA